MTRIVVGVDGSEGSIRALRWALDEAALRNAELEVVHAYDVLPVSMFNSVAYVMSSEELRAHAERLVDEVLQKADATDTVPIRRTVVSGGAAGVLRDQAADADLLVVGTRGHGGFRGLLLGSVSHQVTTHSPCPVVTVPNDHERHKHVPHPQSA